MRMLFTAAIVATCTCLLGASIAANAAESPQSSQVFGCTLNEGATMDDVWAGAEFFRAQLDKIDSDGLDDLTVFLWTPFRATADVDFIWGVNSSNLNMLGSGLSDYYASEAGQAADARFAEFSTCNSGIVFSETIQEGPEAAYRPYDRKMDAVVEAFSCKYRDGKGTKDLNQAVDFWKQQVAKLGSKALSEGYGAYLWTPFRGTNNADFYWVGTSTDIVTWSASSTDYVTSAGGQAADERFDDVADCSSGLWTGYWVVQQQP